MGGVGLLMIKGILPYLQAKMMPSEIKSRGVSVRDVDTNSVALSEQITGWPDLDLILVYLPWFDRRRVLVGIIGLKRL